MAGSVAFAVATGVAFGVVYGAATAADTVVVGNSAMVSMLPTPVLTRLAEP